MPAPSRASSASSADSNASAARTTHDDRDAAIDRVLASINARVKQQHRVTVRPGDAVSIPRGSVTLVYVIEGDLRVHPNGPRTVVPDAALAAHDDVRHLSIGDAQLFTGREAHALRVDEHAFVLLSSLDFTEATAHVLELLPDTILVRDLPGTEPAVAALASMLGPEVGRPAEACSDQAGSSIVCGMMANTVLVSVIRAWAIRGCAPDGWPSRTNDPFLDRVVEAIHADPGRVWTLEDLARTGAMSRSVFAERFRIATGTSPANYLTDVRIRSAQQLLAEGRGVSEVSRAIGYTSDDGFSRAFRRRVGVTPSAWRSGALRASRA
ncbi:AraC family transcriptional regulator [Leucobacter japonicus]|uniref:AraC family transcriptional regulator n=1 Tax=Leucobacter japonicus TaxID=1461259 RepID=UPI0006A7967E|nr:AraC family transcriptional regulator [Leucobacter japonicus]